MSYPPNFDYYQPARSSSASRRASVMMYVIGALVLLSGFCCLGMGAMVPKLAQRPEFAKTIHSIPNMTPARLQAGMLVMGVITAIIGIAYLVLGVFVGKSSSPAIITAIVLSCLCELLLLIYTAAVFTTQRSPAICFLVVPLILIGVLLSWLFQALRSPRSGNMPADYANQYWQYYQQQQNQGMGPYVPPAPPPQMFPPPQPPPPENPPAPPEPPGNEQPGS